MRLKTLGVQIALSDLCDKGDSVVGCGWNDRRQGCCLISRTGTSSIVLFRLGLSCRTTLAFPLKGKLDCIFDGSGGIIGCNEIPGSIASKEAGVDEEAILRILGDGRIRCCDGFWNVDEQI